MERIRVVNTDNGFSVVWTFDGQEVRGFSYHGLNISLPEEFWDALSNPSTYEANVEIYQI